MQLKLSHILRSALTVQSRQLRHASAWTCSELPSRSIIKVAGADSVDLLQRLMTNDIEMMVAEKWRSMYCMFLDDRGRVQFDAIVYPNKGESDFLLEVDKQAASKAAKWMGFFKLKRKVKIDLLPAMQVFSVFDPSDLGSPPGPCNTGAPWGEETCITAASSDHYQCFPDPRLGALGSRLILDKNQSQDIRSHMPEDTEMVSTSDYHHHRCLLGVAEGLEELGWGKVTPLEYNLDFLHGVNFHKGCYSGQELTARTHHTGVIRKRILPLQFSTEIEEEDIDIRNEKGKSVGKVKTVVGKVGLGLMRLKETFLAEKLFVNDSDLEVSVRKPVWWPTDQK